MFITVLDNFSKFNAVESITHKAPHLRLSRKLDRTGRPQRS
jgi:hypothetical protein